MSSPSQRDLSPLLPAATLPSSGRPSPSPRNTPLPVESEHKKRTRNLLRDYYGLDGSSSETSTSGASTRKVIKNKLDIDSPDTFNAKLYFDSFARSSSLPELLRKDNELINEIRELDGERQSLVYNHHHELIEASDTIQKMRTRALALDSSLESLRQSFQSISELATSLSSSVSPTVLPTRESESQSATFAPLVHIPPLLSLPLRLRTMEKNQAHTLWGQWEPALRAWEEAGVGGIKDLSAECRASLKTQR